MAGGSDFAAKFFERVLTAYPDLPAVAFPPVRTLGELHVLRELYSPDVMLGNLRHISPKLASEAVDLSFGR